MLEIMATLYKNPTLMFDGRRYTLSGVRKSDNVKVVVYLPAGEKPNMSHVILIDERLKI